MGYSLLIVNIIYTKYHLRTFKHPNTIVLSSNSTFKGFQTYADYVDIWLDDFPDEYMWHDMMVFCATSKPRIVKTPISWIDAI